MPDSDKKPSFKTDPATWKATLNMMPPGPPRIHVQGTVTFPSGGWTATLTPAKFPDLNVAYYGVEIRYEPPSGPSTDVITELKLDSESAVDNDASAYTHVNIRPVDPEGYRSVDSFLVPIKTVT